MVNNDRVTRLRSGKIIVPTAEHKKMQRADGTVYFDSRSEAVFFVSEDDGHTFTEMPGKGVGPYPSKSFSGLQEPRAGDAGRSPVGLGPHRSGGAMGDVLLRWRQALDAAGALPVHLAPVSAERAASAGRTAAGGL